MDNCVTVDVPTMDGDPTQNAYQRTVTNNEKEERTVAAISSSRGASHHETHQTHGMPIIW